MKAIMIDPLVGNDYALCLCSGLDAIGVETSVVIVEDRKIRIPTEFSVKRLAPSKDPTINKIKKITDYFTYLAKLLNFIVKNDANIVHYQFFRRVKIESIFYIFLKLLGLKLVYTAHNVLPHEHSKIDYFFNFVIYKTSDVIIVHSNYIKNKLAKMFKVSDKKIKVIPHGNFDLYLPERPISKCNARETLNLSETDNVVLFFGYIREYKGLDLLLDAFQVARQSNKKLRLVIAGLPESRYLKEHYREKINRISYNGEIISHLSFVPSEEVATYFTASDIVVLPYKNIDHSGIVHLAYSFGKPLIASNVGDFSETIAHGQSGYLLEKNDPENLAITINKAFSDIESLENMGCFARKLSKTKYSWSDIAKQTKEVYETV